MVRVISDYGIEVAEKCYAVGKIAKVKQKQKDGTYVEVEAIPTPAYFPTFAGCLKWVCKRVRADSIKDIDCDLKTALRAIQTADERMNAALGELGFEIVKK